MLHFWRNIPIVLNLTFVLVYSSQDLINHMVITKQQKISAPVSVSTFSCSTRKETA